jgi:hypothetical protein
MAIVQLEGSGKLKKKKMTLSGIESATFWLVVHLTLTITVLETAILNLSVSQDSQPHLS